MQVKFAYAASGFTRGGEASISVAARAVAASVSVSVAIVILKWAARLAVRFALFDQDNENKKQAASRLNPHARPARSHRVALSRAAMAATLPTRIARARPSACRYGGTFSASVLPAAQAALEIRATILVGGVRARKEMPSALGAGRRRVGLRAGSVPARRRPDADLAQHGEARSRTQAPGAAPFAFDTVRAVPGAKKCADSFETPMTLQAMPTARASARLALIAPSVTDGSQVGAITLHDVRDSVGAVLDVVKV